MDSSAFNSWKLVSLSPLPGWALALLGLAVVLGVVLAGLGVRQEPLARRRWALWGLRACAGVCALFVLLEPGLRRVQIARVKSRVAVLVDRSASMGFPATTGGPTRTASVADALEGLKGAMEALHEQTAFELQGFDPELSPTSLEALRREPPRAPRTDLVSALRAVKASDTGARRLSGVLLFSDGADNAELAQGFTERARRVADELGVPVSTVAVGTSALKDLAVEAVKVDDFAFVRAPVTAEVEVRGRGFAGVTVPVVLRCEGQVIATHTVQFEREDETKSLKFTFTPDQTGRFVYTVGAPVFPDEIVTQNNQQSFSLKVIRDRMRVLLVSGRPSWDERFLRGLLKQDANVELISFYILRNTTDDTGVADQNSELSLIPFPHEEIFRTKLHTFDVVIIMNFDNADRGVSLMAYQRDIKDYVLNGGALVYVGGDRSFGDSASTLSPFADVLPLEAAGPAALEPFRARLTADGQRHPITALATGTQSTQAAWEALPPIPGMNVTRARPGATVLLDHPFNTNDGHSTPLLAVWEQGRGRALALTTDGTWAWAFTSHAAGDQGRAWERFWSNALRWLIRDPDLTTLSVTAEPPSVEPGHPVVIAVQARQADYQPAAGASVTVELKNTDDGHVIATQVAQAGPDGVARVEFAPPPPGAYKATGRASLSDKALGESSDAVAVRAVGPELADARVDAALLQALAHAGGGAFFKSPKDVALGELPLKEPAPVEVGRSRDEPVWDRWYWLTLLVAVVGAEWALRRRFGYV